MKMSIAERNRLVTENLGLIRKTIQVYGLYIPDNMEGDVLGLGVEGMIRAAETWDPARGKWSTYAMPWIRSKLGRALTKNRADECTVPPFHVIKKKPGVARSASLDSVIAHSQGQALTFGDSIPGSHDIGREVGGLDLTLKVREVMCGIATKASLAGVRQAPIIAAIIENRLSDEPRTLEQLGQQCGCTREWVRQLQTVVLGRAKEELAHLYEGTEMKEKLELGPVPGEEKCQQVGADDYDVTMAIAECRLYKEKLEKMFPPVEGARFRITSNQHDFGTYHEVAVEYDDTKPEAVEFAFNVEGNLPATWRE